jgi:hypothetical protein
VEKSSPKFWATSLIKKTAQKSNHQTGENLPNLVTLVLLEGHHPQGDQIGRIFAYWLIVYFRRI